MSDRAVEIPFELVHRGDSRIDWMSRPVARRSATPTPGFETPYGTADIADAEGTGSET